MAANYVMPLAAMCQITKLVQKTAKYGQFNEREVESFLQSIVNLNPEQPEDVYSDSFALKSGYRTLLSQLTPQGDKDVEMVKYVGSIMQLERALSNNPKALSELAKRLKDVERQLQHFEICDTTILAALADIYSEVVSPLGQKIQVFGEPDLLKQTATQQKIRALLLAGIRSAVLWRQLGGKRRQFFFGKKKIIAEAQRQV
ncbi:High frequency lysogenization protein HflD [Pseudoalteromonas holothuriae]|uniref:High frequency lysogenization protein HflD homolog n=1 Tax=Pseudoalteromonas holothuriae TaxID=2963714 RepID=A0A9W4QZU7_9GAMM|nr:MULTISPECIES: high frequency lysogenization protein HflD [unclassified Pseudoalteromonas]CAH9060771.1 High frequency lysogenization protein HflD [Pseudoalteromonas sp. CIP111951]CAH9060945.1 High frequency lysogenization protein HflD [Pseudoalteromonas sp. CIP111854]